MAIDLMHLFLLSLCQTFLKNISFKINRTIFKLLSFNKTLLNKNLTAFKFAYFSLADSKNYTSSKLISHNFISIQIDLTYLNI